VSTRDATATIAAATGAAAAPALSSPEAQQAVDPPYEAAEQAGFNPFGTVGTVVQQQQPAPVPPPPPQGGDWGLPVLVTFAGSVVIGSLLRKLGS
jgi:hypothetical protein